MLLEAVPPPLLYVRIRTLTYTVGIMDFVDRMVGTGGSQRFRPDSLLKFTPLWVFITVLRIRHVLMLLLR